MSKISDKSDKFLLHYCNFPVFIQTRVVVGADDLFCSGLHVTEHLFILLS